jgi:hypothetical protein
MSKTKTIFDELIKIIYEEKEMPYLNFDTLFERVEEDILQYVEKINEIKNKENYPCLLLVDEVYGEVLNEEQLDAPTETNKEYHFNSFDDDSSLCGLVHEIQKIASKINIHEMNSVVERVLEMSYNCSSYHDLMSEGIDKMTRLIVKIFFFDDVINLCKKKNLIIRIDHPGFIFISNIIYCPNCLHDFSESTDPRYTPEFKCNCDEIVYSKRNLMIVNRSMCLLFVDFCFPGSSIDSP